SKAQPIALALNRVDESSTPAAETDNRRVDHRPAKSRTNWAISASAGRSAEILVEEIKDLVPAVDCLFGAVIRAIMRKERGARTVIAMDLVFLAEPLQLRLVAVDLIGCGVRIFIAEQAQQRAIDPRRQIVRRHRLALGQPRLVVDHDI